MFDNEIIKPGERLKKYRKMIKATQSEIAKGECTKNMISQIENNKSKLNEKLANAFVKKINEHIKNKKLDIKLVKVDELMTDEDDQAKCIFSKLINELSEIKVIEIFEQKLYEAEQIIEQYDIPYIEIIKLYKISADFYYYKHKYAKSNKVCEDGLIISIASKSTFEEVNFHIYKSRNNIFNKNYIDAFEQLECAERLNNRIKDNELSVMILYYKALTYKRLGKYDNALECFKFLNKFEIKDSKFLPKIKMVYANCLNDSHKFDEAEKEYKEILEIAVKADDKYFIAQTYRNLSELYYNQEKYEDAIKYIENSLKVHLENGNIGETLHFATKILRCMNKEFETYLLRALEMCERNDRENINLIEQIIYELVIFYISRDSEVDIMLMADKAKTLIIDYSLIYSVISEYYRGRNEKKSIYFSEKSIENSKQIKKIF